MTEWKVRKWERLIRDKDFSKILAAYDHYILQGGESIPCWKDDPNKTEQENRKLEAYHFVRRHRWWAEAYFMKLWGMNLRNTNKALRSLDNVETSTCTPYRTHKVNSKTINIIWYKRLQK